MRELIVRMEDSGRLTPIAELVLCKECKFKRELLFPLPTGETIECGGRYHKPDWFCADGKRKEGDEE